MSILGRLVLRGGRGWIGGCRGFLGVRVSFRLRKWEVGLRADAEGEKGRTVAFRLSMADQDNHTRFPHLECAMLKASGYRSMKVAALRALIEGTVVLERCTNMLRVSI